MSLIPFMLAGALLAGFVSGLAGFGTALVALGIWLHVIEPPLAAPLVAICSVIAHIQGGLTLRFAFDFARLWPFVLGGLAGVPFGSLALDHLEVASFRAAVGLFLVAYCAVMLLSRRLPVVTWGGRRADALVGFGGGIMGGAAGLSGPLPTLWCGLRGWRKDEQRAVYQPFNLFILSWAIAAYAVQGLVTLEVGRLTLFCLPGTLLGVWLGAKAYGRVDDRQFRLLVLWLLLASGVVLTVSNLF